MALTESSMLPLGTVAPSFTLIDTVSGKTFSLDRLQSPHGTVIMFICNHCPFVKHVRPELVKIANDYHSQGITFIAISSNDPFAYPDDEPREMTKIAKENHFNFPYLFDETQDVARAYHAACTPDLYLFDGKMRCVYRGQLDDSRPNNGISLTGKDLRNALDNLLQGHPIDANQKPSMGCNIKWKPKS